MRHAIFCFYKCFQRIVFPELDTGINEIYLKYEIKIVIYTKGMLAVLHDINTPLTAITTSLKSLIGDVEAGSIKHQLHSVLTEVRRVELGFDDVSMYDKTIRTNKSSAIDRSCSEVLALLKNDASEVDIFFRFNVETMPLLPFDPIVIKSIIFNLVVNAIQACSLGETIAVHCQLTTKNSIFEIVVSDTGSGMSQEVYEKCTDMFFSTKPNGRGIGLALCQRVAKEAEGILNIRSIVGFGTRISIQIPLNLISRKKNNGTTPT